MPSPRALALALTILQSTQSNAVATLRAPSSPRLFHTQLRNLAWDGVETSHAFFLDVDFSIAPAHRSVLDAFFGARGDSARGEGEGSEADEAAARPPNSAKATTGSAAVWVEPPLVWIVPAFELGRTYAGEPPKSFADVTALWARPGPAGGKHSIWPFHRRSALLCRNTGPRPHTYDALIAFFSRYSILPRALPS